MIELPGYRALQERWRSAPGSGLQRPSASLLQPPSLPSRRPAGATTDGVLNDDAAIAKSRRQSTEKPAAACSGAGGSGRRSAARRRGPDGESCCAGGDPVMFTCPHGVNRCEAVRDAARNHDWPRGDRAGRDRDNSMASPGRDPTSVSSGSRAICSGDRPRFDCDRRGDSRGKKLLVPGHVDGGLPASQGCCRPETGASASRSRRRRV